MNELSLFSGAGGGLLGTHLLGWRPIGYVERSDYCQRVIAQRIADGILPSAPIFGDMHKFLESGAAGEYRGFADVVSAGWPCQPHSNAGKRLGKDDDREGWPWVAETLRQVKPQWFLGENVGGIRSTDAGRYFGGVLRDLAQMGYVARWGVFSACAFGAPHTRERLFIVAHSHGIGRQRGWQRQRSSASAGRDKAQEWPQSGAEMPAYVCSSVWDTAEADILGMADGVGAKLDRLTATGNGQVPAVVRAAWHLLSEGI